MRIHAIQTGTVMIHPRQRRGDGHGRARLLNTLRDRSWTEPLPILAWAIEHPEGVIVVDTGETARTAEPGYFPRWNPYFRTAVRLAVRPQDEIGPGLRALGIEPEDVRWVVLTHLHTDHAGGLHHFPRSEVLIGRAELHAARGLRGKLNGYLPHRWPAWLAPRPVDFTDAGYGPFARSLALTAAGDVRLLPTPGHTPGHLSVAVEDGEQTVLLAGDVTYAQELLLERVVDGVAPDEAAARDTLARVLHLARERPLVYLPSHDARSPSRLAARAPLPAP